jgi:hypothetical protein
MSEPAREAVRAVCKNVVAAVLPVEITVPCKGECGANVTPEGPEATEQMCRACLRACILLEERKTKRAGSFSEETKRAILFLFTKIGSWTAARWDQQLRYEFGDEYTDKVIRELTFVGGFSPFAILDKPAKNMKPEIETYNEERWAKRIKRLEERNERAARILRGEE